ncbi:ArsR/SmtB family transcription factor [Fontivita pretiosa]|uniref:ArsR/SmtB family transcription factor n=1 Tax=Fontivita pretiosa TaxID=2989684 RepID=UPI003D16C882
MSKLAQSDATEQDLDQLTTVFRLLSDKTRLNILMLLADGEQNVTTLCERLKLPQPTVSHHLGLLRMNNVICNRRNGKQVFYALNGRVNIGDGNMVQIPVDNYTVQIVSNRSQRTNAAAGAAISPPASAELNMPAMA